MAQLLECSLILHVMSCGVKCLILDVVAIFYNTFCKHFVVFSHRISNVWLWNPPEIVYEIHGDYGMKEWLGTHLKVFHIDSVAKVQS